MSIRVGVFGAAGRMGSTVCGAVLGDPDLDLVAVVDRDVDAIDVSGLGRAAEPPLVSDEPSVIVDANADVAVDFTVLQAARQNIEFCASRGIHVVVGTTGFEADELDEYARLFARSEANAVIAPNFAIGAVLMMRFAEIAAPYFDTAEIVETHHDAKSDAPSGTAMLTAQRMQSASPQWAEDPTLTIGLDGVRGGSVGGVRVHSLRIRGMLAHQEVLLGTTGQSLTVRHDSYDRSSFMPGVVLATKRVGSVDGLVVGLDALLDL